MLVQKYNYARIDRETIEGKRHYSTPDGNHVASVTTILQATQSEEKKQKLEEWRVRERAKGNDPEKITQEAADRGTSMHEYLEEYCLTDSLPLEPVKRGMKPREYILSSRGYKMANIIIKEGLKDLNECWAVEAPLFHSGLYAGTTDCAGLYENEEAIVDFKQTNQIKKREWIQDYEIQTVAYSLAHNNMFGTNIKKGVILMCCQDLTFQKFIIEGNRFNEVADLWWNKVDKFYS